MAQLYENSTVEERVILVGIQTSGDEDVQASLDELEDLAETAGALTVAKMIQNREAVHPGTYIGKGKIEEVRQTALALGATGIICDDELSPAQLNNLEQELDLKVMDRTLVILDIFAGRATTSEGKLQVELAQLRYRQARLVGLRSSLSRLGGGIGTRGPGEKKLEMDRRLIQKRIAALRRELEEVSRHRELIREKRKKGQTRVAAIVGYTNAGKSTLLNRLTDAGVLEENQLFATLDPTTRLLKLPDGQSVLLTDTVGFIRTLPPHLPEAIQRTPAEAKYADFLIHVVDASNPKMEEQMQVVYDTLRELGADGKPVITLFNKQDKLASRETLRDFKAEYTILTSAKNGEGLGALCVALEELLKRGKIYIDRIFPYEQAGKIQMIRSFGQLENEEYLPEGIRVTGYVPQEIYGKI